MKSTLHLTLVSLFIGSVCIAQPTITLEDVTPVLGTSVTTVNGPYVEPGPSGADQIWDLSGISAQSADTRQFASPEGLPQAESFPEATHAILFESMSQQYTYTSYSDNTIDQVGFYSIGQNATIHTSYTDPLSQPVFPLNYEDTYSDTYVNQTLNELELGSETTVNVYDEVGSYDAVVDGYGTLITSTGTFEDVLRIHIETEVDWTVSNDGEEMGSGSRTRSEYQYYKAGYPVPIAQMGITINYSDGEEIGTSSFGSYFASSTVGIDDAPTPLSAIEIFPVPAKDHFNLSMQAAEPGLAKIELFSIDGKLAHDWPAVQLLTGSNQQQLNLPELPEGLYLLRISSGASSETRRLVIAK